MLNADRVTADQNGIQDTSVSLSLLPKQALLATSGVDHADDSRAFAYTDIDGDGNLDLILKSRLAPQVRFLQNVCGLARKVGIDASQQRCAFSGEAPPMTA